MLFSKTSEAEAAIQELNGQVYPGTNKEMVVKKKDEPKSTNPHLYVANIPKVRSRLVTLARPYVGSVRLFQLFDRITDNNKAVTE